MLPYISFYDMFIKKVNNSFPINQWDELLPQTILTLNLLRQSNVAPNISAWAYHHGSFDYNRMPLAPMGCAVQFHIKPSRRKTFGEHSADGFYLKTSEEHYRTHVVFCKKTQAKRLADTVFFKHKYITQPMVTPASEHRSALLPTCCRTSKRAPLHPAADSSSRQQASTAL